VKFTERGGVRVRVRAADAEPGGAAAYLFEVEDTGIGFSMERKDALFSRFQQADGSVTRRFGGSGLGLAISHSLAELMGGSLDAVSTQGWGSTFILSLPLRPCAGAAHEAELAPEPGAEPAAGARTGLRVLVADDHVTNRRVVELIMASAGAELVSVENGAEAVEAFQHERFDVVLMDVQMPVMDGLTAIRAIRRLEAAAGLPRTPVLTLTANAMLEHVRASEAAGADGHISKPIRPADLLGQVEAALEAAPAAVPARLAG